MDVCVIGLDFGSLSCRGVLARLDGQIMAETEFAYPHGIMSDALPDGTPLTGNWYLQHPGDFGQALVTVVPALLSQSGTDPARVIGIGADFTASTVIPLDAGLRPLCEQPAFAGRPHAWCKMWKHHGAAAQALRLTEAFQKQGTDLMPYGGKISPECLLAKVTQVYEEDRAVYDAAAVFMEAGDYVTSLLTGRPAFSAAMAAAKAFWTPEGYRDVPEAGFHIGEKGAARFNAQPVAPGNAAGTLCPSMARRLGLTPGIAVSAAQMDGYSPLYSLGISKPGQAMMVIGTSTAILLLHDTPQPVRGVTACLPDTCYPGLVTYAAGQASVGDTFQWFADNCVPEQYHEDARKHGLSVQGRLTQLAADLSPGETGLLVLDWFNGNKSPLGNSRLKGMILGLNLQTKPEHIYRALLEATAFGARLILETFAEAGVPVSSVSACGGIANRNPLLMQIYADVLGLPLHISRLKQAPALGAAICAAAAAQEASGFSDLYAAAEAMCSRDFTAVYPDCASRALYDPIYREYKALADHFGRRQDHFS